MRRFILAASIPIVAKLGDDFYPKVPLLLLVIVLVYEGIVHLGSLGYGFYQFDLLWTQFIEYLLDFRCFHTWFEVVQERIVNVVWVELFSARVLTLEGCEETARGFFRLGWWRLEIAGQGLLERGFDLGGAGIAGTVAFAVGDFPGDGAVRVVVGGGEFGKRFRRRAALGFGGEEIGS